MKCFKGANHHCQACGKEFRGTDLTQGQTFYVGSFQAVTLCAKCIKTIRGNRK